MADFELWIGELRPYGFPVACTLCGSEEEEGIQLWLHKFSSPQPSSPLVYLGCLLMFVGPIGWGIFAWLWNSNRAQLEVPIPVCEECREAHRRIQNRTWFAVVLMVLAPLLLLLSDLPWQPLLGVAVVSGFWATLEHCWLLPQFQVTCGKVSHDRILLRVPYDEYPALYQRHVDTVRLYGSTDSLGLPPECAAEGR